jgi:hypothetical protein
LSILASLIVNASNATNDCFAVVARVSPDALQHRDVNLRHALKGAAIVMQLMDAYERLRGNRPASNVSIGKVNVESGGQAIVGTVQAGQREPEPATGSGDGKKTK